MTGQSVTSRTFETFSEAVTFANKQAVDSVIEIKYYDNKTNNPQNEPYHFS